MSDGIIRCVACGERLEAIFGNHHCSEEFERRRQAIDRREQETFDRGRSEATRLNYGFSLLSLRGDV